LSGAPVTGPLRNPHGEAAIQGLPLAMRQHVRELIRAAYEGTHAGAVARNRLHEDRRLPPEREDDEFDPLTHRDEDPREAIVQAGRDCAAAMRELTAALHAIAERFPALRGSDR
jgi:hypothetical protein